MSPAPKKNDTPEVKLTRSGRPKVAKLDKDAIRLREYRAVRDTLSSIKDPNKRLAKSVKIIDEAKAVIEEYDAFAKAKCLSLGLLEGARAPYDAIGLSRSMYYQMTDEVLGTDYERPSTWTPEVAEYAKKKGVLVHTDAVTELPKLGEKIYAAKMRVKAAEQMRDELVPEFILAGKSPVEVAELIERDRSRIWHLLREAHVGFVVDEDGNRVPKRMTEAEYGEYEAEKGSKSAPRRPSAVDTH